MKPDDIKIKVNTVAPPNKSGSFMQWNFADLSSNLCEMSNKELAAMLRGYMFTLDITQPVTLLLCEIIDRLKVQNEI